MAVLLLLCNLLIIATPTYLSHLDDTAPELPAESSGDDVISEDRRTEGLRTQHRDHTYADLDTYRTLSHFLNLTVDLQENTLRGYVETAFVKVRPRWSWDFTDNYRGLVLDVGPHITVNSVLNVEEGEEVGFEVVCDETAAISVLSCALLIADPRDTVGGVTLRIYYNVTTASSALHFIPYYQTQDKSHNFLVSVTQPSNARGWIPCQDTPALKHPYRAEIRVDKELEVQMSAVRIGSEVLQDDMRVYKFEQKTPVAPFLIAITVGRLVYVDVRLPNEGAKFTTLFEGEECTSPPVRVWGEESVINKIRDTDLLDMVPRMMDMCEMKYGPYPFERYEIVLAPPGYMFQGMEYPGMNYISVTTLDLSLAPGRPNYYFAHIIAHEMIHSWFGDLVTPRYARDAWLAEGITTFEEFELLEEYYADPEVGRFLRRSRYRSLQDVIATYDKESKILTPYLFHQHPFNGFTFIQYNKGALFMEYLANLTSRETMDDNLRTYLSLYKHGTVDSADFVHVLLNHYPEAAAIEREIYHWIARPSTRVPVNAFQSGIYRNCTVLHKILTRNKHGLEDSYRPITMSDVAEAYKSRSGHFMDVMPYRHIRVQLLVVLERMAKFSDEALSKISSDEVYEQFVNKWRTLVNRLDSLFGFTEMTETDPEMFVTWAKLALKFSHGPTVAVTPAVLLQNGRLELVYGLLLAAKDPDLIIQLGFILTNKFDISIYPGFIGAIFRSYIRYYEGLFNVSFKLSEV